MIRLLTEVTAPPKITTMKDVEIFLCNWEEKVRILEKEFGETFSEGMKVAIVLQSLPNEL